MLENGMVIDREEPSRKVLAVCADCGKEFYADSYAYVIDCDILCYDCAMAWLEEGMIYIDEEYEE